jgi:flagellin-like protein
MRTLRRNDRAISEIVGALMLVLIVVVAATALAIFVAQYQKQLQSQESLTHDRQLEDLSVLHVASRATNGSNPDWLWLNFTVASLYINPSIVSYISINDQPLKEFNVSMFNATMGHFVSTEVGVNGNYTLNLAPREQVNVNVSFNQTSSNFSFYNPAYVLPITSYVKIDLFTYLQNDFSRIFIPPTAIAVITPLESFSGGVPVTVPVLDGSNSFAAANSSLENWTWGVTPGPLSFYGEKAVLTNVTTGLTYSITLIVRDSNGLVGTDTFPYKA